MSQSTAKLGQPVPRVEGRAKVTGSARYAADFSLPDLCHAVLVTTTIARGTIRAIDLTAARKAPGVIEILCSENIAQARLAGDRNPFRTVGDSVSYIGQPLAVVVADTPENARFAAGQVRVEYEASR
ncbi:MAG: xanthine dehydrogenase family protein molybdopterin-binding subunit, partial [Phycisphaerae bacterium]|nr:xanthine dehydrogenase family protein molybdopterin-binding subunit [Phycisphaerae bacterium]MDW8262142.1 hypothetical protein [Phycisphaerales bacterium]